MNRETAHLLTDINDECLKIRKKKIPVPYETINRSVIGLLLFAKRN